MYHTGVHHTTWNDWKDHWTAAFAEMRDINSMTSGNSAFANQAAAQEIVQAEKMAALLENLANASIQKNDTIEKLVAINQQQAKSLPISLRLLQS